MLTKEHRPMLHYYNIKKVEQSSAEFIQLKGKNFNTMQLSP